MNAHDEKVTARLASLSGGIQAAEWPAPAQLRRSAEQSRQRQRLGLAGGGAAVLAAAVVAAATLSPATPRSRQALAAPVKVATAARIGPATELAASVSPVPARAGRAAATAVAASEQGLTVRLLRLLGHRAGGNLTISPLSLATALTMLENGASGTTRSQIATTLGASSIPLARQDLGWDTLLSSATAASAGAEFQSADSLWIQRGLPVAKPFLAAQARYFHAGVWQADFVRQLASTERAMNQWASQHTGGAIRKIFSPGDLDQTTRLVVANAAHFTAAWQHPFDPAASTKASFIPSQGRPVSAVYMSRELATGTVTAPGYRAVRLPYAGGRFAAVAIMPVGQNLTHFTAGLTQPELSRIIASTSHGQPNTVFLPRFRTKSSLHLNQTLTALGMPIAFSTAANFSALSPVSLKVQSAVQRDYLSVGEKGTSASAVTGISTQVDSLRVGGLWFNHPFLFLITDTATGTVLFASMVRNPAS
jgi:serine protease inhibitor